jgi:hypothetical protein
MLRRFAVEIYFALFVTLLMTMLLITLRAVMHDQAPPTWLGFVLIGGSMLFGTFSVIAADLRQRVLYND